MSSILTIGTIPFRLQANEREYQARPRDSGKHRPHIGTIHTRMPTGTIKFFNASKGFGFIVSDEGSKEVFLPSAALGGLDSAKLKAGHRVSFEAANEAKGPKAVSLVLLEKQPMVQPQTQPAAHAAIALYHDGACDEMGDVLDALRAQGRMAREVDVATAPPTPQELKKWSLLLDIGSKGLVRRFHPMFHALQLDDRFIGQDEFWTAVSEHPVLIETPLLVAKDRVRVCHSAEDVAAFLNRAAPVEPPKAKLLSPRLAAMIRGEAVPEKSAAAPEQPAPTEIAPAPKTARPPKNAAARPRAASAAKAAAKPQPKKPAREKPAPGKKAPAKKTATAKTKKVKAKRG